GGMACLVENTITGRKRSPTPPSASKIQAAMSWKTEPDGTTSRNGESRLPPAPCDVAPVPTGSRFSRRSCAARCLHRQILAVVPLLGERREGAIGVHVIDDLAHGSQQRCVCERAR